MLWRTSIAAEKHYCACGIGTRKSYRENLEILSHHPLVKGVRRNLQGEPVDFLKQPGFHRGLKILPEFDFTFDLCVRAEQLPAANRVDSPSSTGNVCAGSLWQTGGARQKFRTMARNLRALAKLPNVVCKISGLTTEANWSDWESADLEPYFDHTLYVLWVAPRSCSAAIGRGDSRHELRTGGLKRLQLVPNAPNANSHNYSKPTPKGFIVFSLKNKTALVTGAASGIGAAIAETFAPPARGIRRDAMKQWPQNWSASAVYFINWMSPKKRNVWAWLRLSGQWTSWPTSRASDMSAH